MYAEFFGLRELPFNNTPDPRYFFSTPHHEEALASLIYAVQERKGFMLLTGEVGAGKTLVSRMMLRHFGSTITFANINHSIHGARDLMESVCAEFEIDVSPGVTHTQLVRLLHDYLLARFARNSPVVLVLDEAQNLSIEAFEQLRMIGNLEADDAKLLQIVIVGQPELQGVFNSPQLRQLKQRLFCSFHLSGLDRRLTETYIRHRLTVSNAVSLDLFTEAAIGEIFNASGGLPRVINTVCDNALLSAYSLDRRTVDDAIVRSTIAHMLLVGKATALEGAAAMDNPLGIETKHLLPKSKRLDGPEKCSSVNDDDHQMNERSDTASTVVSQGESIHCQIERIRGQLREWHHSPRTPGALPSRMPVSFTSDRVSSAIRNELNGLHDRLEAAVKDSDRRMAGVERQLALTPRILAEVRSLQAGVEPVLRRAETVLRQAGSTAFDSSPGVNDIIAGPKRLRPTLRRLRRLSEHAESSLVRTAHAAPASDSSLRAKQVVQRLSQQAEQGRELLNGLRRTLGRIEPSASPAAPFPPVESAVVGGA